MAKAYNFSLQKVLDVRKHTEDQRSVELSRSRQKLKQEQERLEHLSTQKNSILSKDTYNASEIEVSLNDLKVTNNYIEQLNKDIHLQQDQVNRSNSEVETNRNELMNAMKDKKAVELLKERYTARYNKMKNLEASKNESEVALRIAMKNKEQQ
jgi:flagellar FliJ protein